MPTSPIPAPAVTNLQHASDQLFGNEDPGLAKSNLIYALEQLGIYVPPGDSEPEPEVIIPPAPIDSGGDSYVPPTDSSSNEPFSPTEENYQDYLTGQRDVAGMLAGGLGPIGNLATAGMDYNMGYNPIAVALTDDNEGFTDPLGDYRGFYNDNYSGPGHDYAVSVGLTPGTEQYDMVVTSMGYDVESEAQKDKGLFGGFINNPFDSRTFNYDPDMEMKGFEQGVQPSSINDFANAYKDKSAKEFVVDPNRGSFTDINNADSYSNPYAGEDLGSSFSDASLGATNSSYSSNNDGTGVFTSDEVGDVNVTEYGDNQYGVDLGGGEEVG